MDDTIERFVADLAAEVTTTLGEGRSAHGALSAGRRARPDLVAASVQISWPSASGFVSASVQIPMSAGTSPS